MSDALTDVRERGDVPWEGTYASRVRFERIVPVLESSAEMNTKIGENRRLLVCGSLTEKVRNGLKTAPWDRTMVRLSNGYSLLNHVITVVTAWGRAPWVLFLVQQRGEVVAVAAVVTAVGVFGWHEVTDFNANFGFLCSHVI